MKRGTKIFLIILFVLLVIAICTFAYIYFTKFNKEDENNSNSGTSIGVNLISKQKEKKWLLSVIENKESTLID